MPCKIKTTRQHDRRSRSVCVDGRANAHRRSALRGTSRLRGLSPIYGYIPFVIITQNLKCSIGHLCPNRQLWADLKYVNDNQWVDDDADDDGGDDHGGGDDHDSAARPPIAFCLCRRPCKCPPEVCPPRHLEASGLISDIWVHPVCNNHPKSEIFHRSFMH